MLPSCVPFPLGEVAQHIVSKPGFEIKTPRFEFLLFFHFLAGSPLANYLTSLHLDFLFSEIGMLRVPTSSGYHENRVCR